MIVICKNYLILNHNFDTFNYNSNDSNSINLINT